MTLVSVCQRAALNATTASDVTVDGFHGQQIEFTVPDYNETNARTACSRCFSTQRMLGGSQLLGPVQYLRLWILDIDGTRYVIAGTYYPETS